MLKRITILCLICLLAACSEQPSKEPSQQTTEENYVVAKEKVMPENFEQLAVEGTMGSYNDYYAQKANNEEQFQELWTIFQMKGELPDIDFTNNTAYFISFYESSSCLQIPQNVEIEGTTLSFSLESPGRKDIECTADQTPRTLVLKLESSNIENILIIENEVTTQIPL